MTQDNKIDYIERQSESQSLFQECIYDLRHIAKCLSIVGNTELSNKIFTISNDIELSKDIADEAFVDCLDQYTSSVQQGTANMISLALGLIEKIQ